MPRKGALAVRQSSSTETLHTKTAHSRLHLRMITKEGSMRYFVAALGLVVALGFGHFALAADNGWGNSNNGNGQYHVSNG